MDELSLTVASCLCSQADVVIVSSQFLRNKGYYAKLGNDGAFDNTLEASDQQHRLHCIQVLMSYDVDVRPSKLMRVTGRQNLFLAMQRDHEKDPMDCTAPFLEHFRWVSLKLGLSLPPSPLIASCVVCPPSQRRMVLDEGHELVNPKVQLILLVSASCCLLPRCARFAPALRGSVLFVSHCSTRRCTSANSTSTMT